MADRQLEFEALLKQLSEGSEDAAWRIIEVYSPNIMRVVRRNLPQAIRPKLDSLDIVQSVWRSLFFERERLTMLDTPQRFVTYLAAMARTKVLENYRHYTQTEACDINRERRYSEGGYSDVPDNECEGVGFGLASNDPTASAVALAKEVWQNTLDGCTTRDEEIMRLRMKGLSNEEIATELNMTSRTVRRVMQRLFETMKT